MIYFDNAATTHPKPEAVYELADQVFRAGGSPGRSAHQIAVAASRLVFETRLALAEFLGINSAERLIFTPGCTHSLNYVLKGLSFQSGDTVLVSSLEHNALMRPLHQLVERHAIRVLKVPYSPGEILSLELLSEILKREKPRLCAFLEASNLTGEFLDLPSVAELCFRHNVPLLIDAAQSAGTVKSNLSMPGLSYWTASGHKGFFGQPGLGLLYVSPEAPELESLISGGTGSRSENLEMPAAYPDHLEAGSMSASAVAALGAGLAYLNENGIEALHEKALNLRRQFLTFLSGRSGFNVFSPQSKMNAALVAFEIQGLDSALVADLLDRDYGICVRAGLHCALAAHQSLGSSRRGLLRASFSCFNTEAELQIFCAALDAIRKSRA
ncbi:MAG: aminotransferase class V-fold PLP-dependent enzyme [Candidatus Obscuribacterales bacterium]|nr:aminotransferase class V-fold PLP-dependent enzyme [Candidatus Obscuribacterales bacterium]